MVSEHLARAGGVFAYSLAALFGVIAANYITMAAAVATYGAWIKLLLGAVIFAIPVFGIRGNSGWEGPVRLFLGVTGLTVFLRAILDTGNAGLTGLNASLPPQISAIV